MEAPSARLSNKTMSIVGSVVSAHPFFNLLEQHRTNTEQLLGSLISSRGRPSWIEGIKNTDTYRARLIYHTQTHPNTDTQHIQQQNSRMDQQPHSFSWPEPCKCHDRSTLRSEGFMCHACYVHELFDHRRAMRTCEEAFVTHVMAAHRAQFDHDFLTPRDEVEATPAAAAVYGSALAELHHTRAHLVAVRRTLNDARMRYVAWEELFVKDYGPMSVDVVKYLVNPSPSVPSRSLSPPVSYSLPTGSASPS